jgi:hypothetical protein
MTPRKNPALAATLAELEARGVAYSIEQGKHLKVKFAAGLVVVSSTPSSWRSAVKARGTVRRLLRRGAS